MEKKTLSDNSFHFDSIKLNTGITMSYAEIGTGTDPAVVLIHGATDSYLSFSQIAPRLADGGYHVYIPELRGHGNSDKTAGEMYTVELMAKDIRAFMTQLSITTAHIAGHSIGSFIAQELAVEPSCKIMSLTLIGTSGKVLGNPTLSWLLNGDEEFPGVIKLNGKLPDDFIKDWTDSTNEETAFTEAIYRHAKELPADTWLNIFCGAESFDHTERLAKIKVPVQVIWGTEDAFFDLKEQMSFISGLGSDKILFIKKDGASHNTHWESGMAEEIAEDIKRFIRYVQTGNELLERQ